MAIYNANTATNFREYATAAAPFVGPTLGITVSCWLWPNTATSNSGAAIVSGANSLAGQWQIGTANATGTNLLRFSIRNGANTQASAIDATAWVANRWHHVVGWWDLANAKIYRDGVEVGSAALTGTLVDPVVAIRTFLRTDGTTPMDCRLSHFGLWRRALTVGEITYLAGGGDFNKVDRSNALILDPMTELGGKDSVLGLGLDTGTITLQNPAPVRRVRNDASGNSKAGMVRAIRKRYRNAGVVIQDVGWQSAPTMAQARAPTRAPMADVPLPAASVSSLGLTGFEPPAPRTISPRGKVGSNWDGPRLAALATTGFEPLGPQTTSPRGNPGISFDASLLFAALARSGWEPGAAAVRQLRALFPGMETPGPSFVAPLLSTGWESASPAPRALARVLGWNWDGPLVAMLRASGWEPPGPQTVSPRGRGTVNWDGPLVPLLGPGGWEPSSPIARQLRRLFPDAPPPLLAFLLTSGFEPPGPSTRSPIGKGAVNFDGSGLLAALGAGGWYPAAPSPSSPRGKQGVNFDAAGLLAALGLTGWEALPPAARQSRPRAPALDAPLAPFVIALSPTGWEQPGPRTLAPHGAPGPNFYGWPAFPLRSGGFEPPGPRTLSPRGKLALSFDGPLSALAVALAQAGWETATPLPRRARGAGGVNADAGILIPPRLVTGWEPGSPYLPRAPRPGIGWNFADPALQAFLRASGWEPEPPRTHSPRGLPGPNYDGPWLAFLGDAGWEPLGPETVSPRGQGGISFDGLFAPFVTPPVLVMIPAIPGGRGALLIIVPSRTRIG